MITLAIYVFSPFGDLLNDSMFSIKEMQRKTFPHAIPIECSDGEKRFGPASPVATDPSPAGIKW